MTEQRERDVKRRRRLAERQRQIEQIRVFKSLLRDAAIRIKWKDYQAVIDLYSKVSLTQSEKKHEARTIRYLWEQGQPVNMLIRSYQSSFPFVFHFLHISNH